MSRRSWTAEEVDELRSRYAAGETDEDIGVRFGRTGGSVANCRQTHRITRPNQTLKRPPLWSADTIAQAKRLYAEGWPNSVIAKEVGRTAIAIKRFVTIHQLERDPAVSIDPARFNSAVECWRLACVESYAVSSMGRVLSLQPGNVGRILSTWTDPHGYQHVTLRIALSNKRYAVHALVCTAFHGPRPAPTFQAAHNNGRSLDNRAVNLRWATPQENQADRLLHGTAHRRPNGKFLPVSTTKAPTQADMVRRAKAAGVPVMEVGGG